MLSDVRRIGSLRFPEFSGVRVMMMPFLLEDLDSIPRFLDSWVWAIRDLVGMSREKRGTAYLTIDEAVVPAGRTHRRPGVHVDGVGPDGKARGWGGGGGWGAEGMLVASSHVGCRAWAQDFVQWPKPNGDCAHLKDEFDPSREVVLGAGEVYWFGPLTVHESMPMPVATRRQFVRLSMPSGAPWYDGYTRNPLGVEPTGPIHPARTEFMAYAP